MIRKSTAVWKGDGPHGAGTLNVQSGAFKDQPYSAKSRFESVDGKLGTNPEELLGAAHAGCFSMALAFGLTGAGLKPDTITVTANVDLQPEGGGFTIKMITLDLQAKIPGLDEARFQEIAKVAKENCPLSKALHATPITLNAKLVS